MPLVIEICNCTMFDGLLLENVVFFMTLHGEFIVDVAHEIYTEELRNWF
jgi:hypothetical protein